MQLHPPERQQLEELLAELNELEQRYGRVPSEAEPLYRPSGEVNSRINLLKEKIARLGASIAWVDNRYQLVEGPDEERDA